MASNNTWQAAHTMQVVLLDIDTWSEGQWPGSSLLLHKQQHLLREMRTSSHTIALAHTNAHWLARTQCAHTCLAPIACVNSKVFKVKQSGIQWRTFQTQVRVPSFVDRDACPILATLLHSCSCNCFVLMGFAAHAKRILSAFRQT